jgi:flavin reductase (DIM6/NTAB) family NADH-FMN oxidoreductase RutF
VLNVIPLGQSDYVKHFAKGFDAGDTAFAGLAVERTAGGVAILPDALGHLVCRVTGRVDGGDHELLIARVEGGRLHADGKPWIHVRKSGLSY